MFVGTGEILNKTGKIIFHKEPTNEITLETLFNWLDGGDFMQPSSAFTRKAWIQAGQLDEEIHIAIDLDYWMRIAKCQFVFVTVNQLLSQALSHETAKTTAFKNHMIVDAAIAIIRHGGEKWVRKHLDEMATKLSYLEPNYNKIVNNRLVKLLLPIAKVFIKPVVRYNEGFPSWTKDAE
jgi:hypothetical protein